MNQHNTDKIEKDAENKKLLADELNKQKATLDEIKNTTQTDRTKNREKFQKVNEALAALEHHLEQGNKKMDKILNSEIQSR